MQAHRYNLLLLPWYLLLLLPAALLLKIAALLTRLYEQPAGTPVSEPSSKCLIRLGTSSPAFRAASYTAAKHSLAAALRWPAGHSFGLRNHPDGATVRFRARFCARNLSNFSGKLLFIMSSTHVSMARVMQPGVE